MAERKPHAGSPAHDEAGSDRSETSATSATQLANGHDRWMKALVRRGLFGEDAEHLRLGRFQLERSLGAGAMGIVYRAYDLERGTHVALKVLHNVDADGIARFKREFRALADLSHPNLVPLYELHVDRERWFFTMELVEGVDFLRHVRGRAGGDAHPASPRIERLRDALAQLCHGVLALHAAGHVHRDIKPTNVLVTAAGHLYLLDFGVIGDLGDTGDLAVVGTPAYMAPEQTEPGQWSPASDWYAVGVMLYEALTGRRPHQGSTAALLAAKRATDPSHPTRLADVPSDLAELCMYLLARDPARRAGGEAVLASLGEPPPRPGEIGLRPPKIGSRARPPSQPGTSFLGRREELARLTDAFAIARGGRQVTVLVESESGMGKTALGRHFAAEVVAQGSMALVGRCYEREAVPYKALDGVMESLARQLARANPVDAAMIVADEGALVGRLFPVLRHVQALTHAVEPRVASPQELRSRAFAATRRIFERLAARQGLLVLIDDLQWADADSWLLLEEILHPPDAPTLLFLATARSGTDIRRQLDRIRPDVEHLQLGPLAAADAEALAGSLLEPVRSDVDARAIAQEAGGHPLYLQELARYARASGFQSGRITLDDALASRIGRLDEPARRLLEVVAVAGARVDELVAGAAAEIEPGDVARTLSVLRASNLVRTQGVQVSRSVETYHDRIGEIVAARLDLDAARSYHRALARAMESAGAADRDPESLVRHLETAGDQERAASHAARAGERAVRALAFDRAAHLFGKALALGTHSSQDRRVLLSQRGRALANAGRGPEAGDAFLAAAEGADAAFHLEHMRMAAEQFLTCGHVERGLTIIRTVLDEIGLTLPATPRRALAIAAYWRARLWLRGLRWRERDPSTLSPRDLEQLDVHKALAQGLALVDNVRGMVLQSRGLLVSLRAGHKTHIARSLGAEAVYRSSTGRAGRRRAQRLLDEAMAIAEQTGDPYLRAWAVGTPGICDSLVGRFAAALPPLVEAEELLEKHVVGSTWELNNERVFLLWVLSNLGRYRDRGARLTRYLRDARRRGDRFVETTLVRAFNDHWLVLDDPDAARRELAATRWSPPETGFLHLQHAYEAMARAALVLYGPATDDDVRAAWDALAPVGRSQLMRVQVVRMRWTRIVAWLWLVAPTHGRDPVREARRLTRRLDREGIPCARGWALLLRAALAHRRGDRAGAAALLRDAIAACEAGEVFAHAAAARWRLGDLIGGDEGAALRADAETWMHGEGICNPERFARLQVPGFDA